MVLALITLLGFLQFPTTQAVNTLKIDTTSGPVQGAVDSTTPNVAHFLNIPFAEKPLGERRWLPPSPKSKQETTIDATKFGPACSQFESDAPSLWNTDVPEYIVTPRNFTGEDCLSVNVWTPFKEKHNHRRDIEEALPVIAWIHGGSFQTGGPTVPYQDPSSWVERSKKHIVVGINYRLNIFGFPNAAGLKNDEQNLGFLDQRLAVEWIRDNIAKFGGDPNRITLWGQSAGAASVDNYNFAYPEDPIVSGLIMNSGTSTLPLASDISRQTNFTFVAQHFECGNSSAAAEVDCLRAVNSTDIMAFLKQRVDNGATPSLAFNPVFDERTKFANVTDRALAGKFTRKPAIIGTNSNEGAAFLPYNQTHGGDQALADGATLAFFLCPAVKTTSDRYAADASTFRYLYGGNFSNIAPQFWQGAYHSAELPLIFGTHEIARSKSTPLEVAVSEKMQDYWVAFAEDAVNGLPKAGWEAYEPQGEGVLIGYEGVVVQGIKEAELEKPCTGGAPNGLPPPPVKNT